MNQLKKCTICSKAAEYKCGACFAIDRYQWYCSIEHQKRDWKNHKSNCMPITIKENEELGKHLVATRDIGKRDLILRELPLFTAPEMVTFPLCLSCYAFVDGKYKCKDCRWPMCGSSKCKKAEQHKAECKYTKRRGIVGNIKHFYVVDSVYEYVAPLRCLFTCENDKEKYKKIRKMKSKTEIRKERGKLEMAENMKKYFKLGEFTLEEVMHACGVVEVNQFMFHNNTHRIGIYNIASLLTHSCVPNTIAAFTMTDEIVINASKNIKKGEVLYVSYCFSYLPTYLRKLSLNKRYITCACKRCKDPTEFCTYMGCVKCQSCSVGIVFPPLAEQTEWVCRQCGKIMAAKDVESMMSNIEDKINKITNVDQCESFLKYTFNKLSDFHYLRTSIKLYMCAISVIFKTESISRITDEDKMIEIYERTCELIEVSNMIDFAGYSDFRGGLFYTLMNTMLWLYQYSKVTGNKETARERLNELKRHTADVRAVLLPDSISHIERAAYVNNELIGQIIEVLTEQ